jgi:Kef-type K+ transport system membrane component KefB
VSLLIVGGLLVVALLLKSGLRRLGVPALVGYLLLGVALSLANGQSGFLEQGPREALELLGGIGVVMLLFRVGLEADVRGLTAQLPRAGGVWAGDILLSGGLAFAAAWYLLDAALVPSLLVAVAMMATSVSVSVSVWQDEEAIDSPNGELLLDVAEADDISSAVAMVLLFSAVPALAHHEGRPITDALLSSMGWLLVEAVAFAAICWIFARYLEQRVTRLVKRATTMPDPVIVMAGTGCVIAALAAWLGFPAAIGALLAGLMFSRDPEAVRMEPSFAMLYDLFTPFFFIGIGVLIEPGVLAAGLLAGGLLLIPAAAGKLVGAGLPALLELGWTSAALIGVSMMPRAEIALIVADRGRRLGDQAMPPELFAGLMVVSLTTALVTPLVLRPLLVRWPQQRGSDR